MPCPRTPNCVSSQGKNSGHFIQPLTFEGSLEHAKQKLRRVINSMRGTKIITKDDFYWITKVLNNFATKHCKGKLISCLEGGYNIKALSESCLEHVKGLIL